MMTFYIVEIAGWYAIIVCYYLLLARLAQRGNERDLFFHIEYPRRGFFTFTEF